LKFENPPPRRLVLGCLSGVRRLTSKKACRGWLRLFWTRRFGSCGEDAATVRRSKRSVSSSAKRAHRPARGRSSGVRRALAAGCPRGVLRRQAEEGRSVPGRGRRGPTSAARRRRWIVRGRVGGGGFLSWGASLLWEGSAEPRMGWRGPKRRGDAAAAAWSQ
jgi:hypothetical protein